MPTVLYFVVNCDNFAILFLAEVGTYDVEKVLGHASLRTYHYQRSDGQKTPIYSRCSQSTSAYNVYSKTCLKRHLIEVKSIAECSEGEHSAILSISIKLIFPIKALVLSIFKWPLKTGFTVHRSVGHRRLFMQRNLTLMKNLKNYSKQDTLHACREKSSFSRIMDKTYAFKTI